MSQPINCPKCGHAYPPSDFNGKEKACRSCRNERARKWRNAHRLDYNQYHKVYRSDPEQARRHACRQSAATLVKTGRLIQPSCCEVCGRPTTELHFHHWSYNDPGRGTWCCSSPCHPALDAKRRAVTEAEQALLAKMFPVHFGGAADAKAA